MDAVGAVRWVIAEGWLPGWANGPRPQLVGHETACILNTSDRDAHVRITVFFEDREPLGPFEVLVPARRTLHQRFDDLTGPGQVPRATNYSSVIDSDVPVVVQHTRLDSRSSRLALVTTMAHPA